MRREKSFSPRNPQRIDRQQDFFGVFAGGRVLQPQQLRARLEELRRAVRLAFG